MPSSLKLELLKNSSEFSFFQAVKLMELLGYSPNAGLAEGTCARLRFRTENSMAFPSSDTAGITLARDGNEAVMRLTFMGLYGVSTPLPSYFSDPVTLRVEAYKPLQRLLDIFGHRIYTLFYLAWKKYRHHENFIIDGSDSITQFMYCLTGQGNIHLEKQQTLSCSNLLKLPYGQFVCRVRSAEGLRQLLSEYFGLPMVQIRQFCKRWVPNPAVVRLGRGSRLGADACLGEWVEDAAGAFQVVIGPLDAPAFSRFQGPDMECSGAGPLGAGIRRLVNDYLKDPLDFGITVILSTRGITPVRLGKSANGLGKGAWIGEKPPEVIFLGV